MISNTSSTNGTPPPHIPSDRTRKSVTAPSIATEVLSTSSLGHLQQALAADPEIRPEMVEHGERLASDANYPPRAIIEDIARQIVESDDLSSQD